MKQTLLLINTNIFSTILVTIRNSSGGAIKLRAVLDCGSQASFVTEDVAQASCCQLTAAK